MTTPLVIETYNEFLTEENKRGHSISFVTQLQQQVKECTTTKPKPKKMNFETFV
jgi:hypothetical protein